MNVEELTNLLAGTTQYPYFSDRKFVLRGAIKKFEADFAVAEIPLYEASGEGDHLYVEIEKRGMTTAAAIGKIARSLSVAARDIGVAGQKDARAVTRQFISIEHVSASDIASLDIPGIRVLNAVKHRNKLKMGHLRGNRFSIRLRDTDIGRVDDVARMFAWLEINGVPNYFGNQRFGARGDNWLVGRALLQGNHRLGLSLILGLPTPELEGEAITRARCLFETGAFEAAADAWPRGFGQNARLCRMFEKNGGHFKRTLMSMGKKILTFYVSAYQSYLFNHIVADRISSGTLQKMQCGDVAWKHDKGVCFHVENAEAETLRAMNGEISPSGPLYGQKMKWPLSAPGELEQRLLEGEGLTVESFQKKSPWSSPGGRRPMRVFPTASAVKIGSDDFGDYLALDFSLPPGAYATVLLRELCKSDVVSELMPPNE